METSETAFRTRSFAPWKETGEKDRTTTRGQHNWCQDSSRFAIVAAIERGVFSFWWVFSLGMEKET